jgi:hypothetical protein
MGVLKTSQGDPSNFWYSFDVGSVHIVSSSSEHDYSSPDDPQVCVLQVGCLRRAQIQCHRSTNVGPVQMSRQLYGVQ